MKHLKKLMTCPMCGRVYQTSHAKTCGRSKCREEQRQLEQELRDKYRADNRQLPLF